MRRLLVVAALGALAVGPAMADSRLGGGLLEFVVTGGRAPRPSTTVPAEVDSSLVLGGTFVTAAVPASPGVRLEPLPPAEPPLYASIAPAAPTVIQAEIPPQFLRQEVVYTGEERPGVVIIDTPDKFLFFVEPGGRAIRYGIGVGRPGFAWAGVKTITRKAEWPDWTPPAEMMLRRPDLPVHMVGGPENPLGARALYLGSSLYRIHGTNEPWSIGQNVSSGCIRMMNNDVIDLYMRVRVGTTVIVR